MNSRPRDLCTAAFNDDVERLRQLIVAAGVFTGRWQPPCHVNTSPAIRTAIEADIPDSTEYDDDDDGSAARLTNASAGAAGDIVGEDVAEEMAEVMSEEEVAALMAHPALQRVAKAYALDAPIEEGDDDDNADDSNAVGENGETALLDEEEEEAAEADRQAQQHDLLIFRCLLAEQRHRDSIAQRLRQHGLLQSSTTPPVNMTSYGIMFSCRERQTTAPSPSHERAHDAAAASAAEDEDSDEGKTEESVACPAGTTSLQVRWQPSKRSRYAGTALHWAVLGRAHATVRFLIQHGADEAAGLRCVDDVADGKETSAPEDDDEDDTTASAAKVLQQLTPTSMAAANESLPTLQVLEVALATRAAELANCAALFDALEGRMQRRQRRYTQRRQMAAARRALEVQARREEAERAAAAEQDEGEEDGEGEEVEEEGEAEG